MLFMSSTSNFYALKQSPVVIQFYSCLNLLTVVIEAIVICVLISFIIRAVVLTSHT